MKHLRIEVDGMTLFDGDVHGIQFVNDEDNVGVSGTINVKENPIAAALAKAGQGKPNRAQRRQAGRARPPLQPVEDDEELEDDGGQGV